MLAFYAAPVVTDARRPRVAAAARNGRQSRPLSPSSLPSALKQSPHGLELRPGQEPSCLAAQAREGARGRAGRPLARPRPLRRHRRRRRRAGGRRAARLRLAARVARPLASLRRRPGAARRRDDLAAARLDDDAALGRRPVRRRHGRLRDRQRAGDGRLDLDLEAARPQVPRSRPAFGPRPGVFQAAGHRCAEGERARPRARHRRRVLAVAPCERAGRRPGAAPCRRRSPRRRRRWSRGWA